MKTLLFSIATVIVFCSSCHDYNSTFPVVLTMNNASIDGSVASALGTIVFPEYSEEIAVVSKWAEKLKGMDVKTNLTVNPDSLIFQPDDVQQLISSIGLNDVKVSTKDVKDIYRVTGKGVLGGDGYQYLILSTSKGKLVCHLNGEGLDDTLDDFATRRDKLVKALTGACKQAHYSEIRLNKVL